MLKRFSGKLFVVIFAVLICCPVLKVMATDEGIIFDDLALGEAVEDALEDVASLDEIEQLDIDKAEYDVKLLSESDLDKLTGLRIINLHGFRDGVDISHLLEKASIQEVHVSDSIITDEVNIRRLLEENSKLYQNKDPLHLLNFVSTNVDYLSRNTVYLGDDTIYSRTDLDEVIKSNVGAIIEFELSSDFSIPDLEAALEDFGQGITTVIVNPAHIFTEGTVGELAAAFKDIDGNILFRTTGLSSRVKKGNSFIKETLTDDMKRVIIPQLRYCVSPSTLYSVLNNNLDLFDKYQKGNDLLSESGYFVIEREKGAKFSYEKDILGNGAYKPEGTKGLLLESGDRAWIYRNGTKKEYAFYVPLYLENNRLFDTGNASSIDEIVEYRLDYLKAIGAEETKYYAQLSDFEDSMSETEIGQDDVSESDIIESEEGKDLHHSFTDITRDRWSDTYINEVWKRGIVNGYPDLTFKPSGELTGAAWGKMILIAGDYSFDNGTTYWFSNGERILYKEKLVRLEDNFYSKVGISREQVAMLAVRLIEKKNGEEILIDDEASVRDMINDYDEVSEALRSDVLKAYDLGLFGGDNLGNFNPKMILTREQAAKVIIEVLNKI